MAETTVVAVYPGMQVEVATPALVENASGLDTAWVGTGTPLLPPHRGHALRPGERLLLPFAGAVAVETDASVELVVTRW